MEKFYVHFNELSTILSDDNTLLQTRMAIEIVYCRN